MVRTLQSIIFSDERDEAFCQLCMNDRTSLFGRNSHVWISYLGVNLIQSFKVQLSKLVIPLSKDKH